VSDWFRAYGFADVRDQLLIGAYPLDAADVQMLGRLGITRVLNLVQDGEYEPGQRSDVESALAEAGIPESRLELVDYGHLPAETLEAAVDEVVSWLEAGERSYVHCRAGWQRSAAVAAGVIAVRDGVGIEEALDRVRARKPMANPLPEQRDDLLAWWYGRGSESGSA
jgi:protein-tyrosine phosphatase